MFNDAILERIFSHEKAQEVPIVYQATMIHVIEQVLEKESDCYSALCKSNVFSATTVSAVSATDTPDADYTEPDALAVDTESYNGYQW